MRSSHPALAMWWEETRRAEARQDVRSELFALNMVLKAYGPPRVTFGALPGFPVGVTLSARTWLTLTLTVTLTLILTSPSPSPSPSP